MIDTDRRALVVGASRGLGLTLAAELVRRGWWVVATARQNSAELDVLSRQSGGQLIVEPLEMTSASQLECLRGRLEDGCLDLLFVNAAIDRGDEPITRVSSETFTEVMVTNAWAPLRTVDVLGELVAPGGTVAVMSSDQGSISLNTEDGYELYKASKAALNQLMRSEATRRAADGRTRLLIDPGHNRTRLGGPQAPLEPEESIPAVVDVLESQAGAGGLQFLDRHGAPVPW